MDPKEMIELLMSESISEEEAHDFIQLAATDDDLEGLYRAGRLISLYASQVLAKRSMAS